MKGIGLGMLVVGVVGFLILLGVDTGVIPKIVALVLAALGGFSLFADE